MIKQRHRSLSHKAGVTVLALALCATASADSFTEEDMARWKAEYMSVVDNGEKLFHGGLNSKNTVSCDQCHPNGTNTHPETYPKFQQQLGKVAALWEMINWFIMNPLESPPLAADHPKLTALQLERIFFVTFSIGTS